MDIIENSPILEVRNLKKNYDKLPVLKDISFSAYAGSVISFIGSSGSGKSTLIRHINRLIEPTDGKVIVDGDDVMEMSSNDLMHFRRFKASMVFQKFALLPHRTVAQNAAYGLTIQGVGEGEAVERSQRWLERVGLGGFEKHFPAQLSGGMQQRVGLARALTNDGEILLMDEAFSALDPLIRKDMQDILLELQDELHKTVVFITHDLDEALKIGDRIAILKDGIMDQEGIPADILLSPKTQYVKDFVEDVNRARVIKAKHIMSKLNGQDRDNAMFVDQDDFIDRFIDKVISDKPNCLIVKNKNNEEIGYLSTKRLSEILKR